MFFHNSVAVVCLTVPNVCSTFLANLPIGA